MVTLVGLANVIMETLMLMEALGYLLLTPKLDIFIPFIGV